MSKEMSVMVLGIAVVIIPYLGVPSAWRTILLVFAGLALILIGFLMRSHGSRRAGKSSPYQPFVESLPDREAGDAAHIAHDHSHESHKEGISSLN